MSNSRLQQPFLEELIGTIRSSRRRIAKGLAGEYTGSDDQLREWFGHLSATLGKKEKEMIDRIVWDELRGVLHGILVTFDGGTALADRGLIHIEDEDGDRFDRHLHELAVDHLTSEELE